MLSLSNPQVKSRYAVGDLVWIKVGTEERLERHKGCWGQVTIAEDDIYAIMIGTAIVKRISPQNLQLIEDVDKQKAKKYLLNAMRVKFSFFSLEELQYLIGPCITTVEWLKIR